MIYIYIYEYTHIMAYDENTLMIYTLRNYDLAFTYNFKLLCNMLNRGCIVHRCKNIMMMMMIGSSLYVITYDIPQEKFK